MRDDIKSSFRVAGFTNTRRIGAHPWTGPLGLAITNFFFQLLAFELLSQVVFSRGGGGGGGAARRGGAIGPRAAVAAVATVATVAAVAFAPFPPPSRLASARSIPLAHSKRHTIWNSAYSNTSRLDPIEIMLNWSGSEVGHYDQ